ncbi:GNAT family N-acetyltransferase [Ruminococcaceae bacterium OttesenSCG-928-L11]|nr:GNAT family N-acetyltransferase [Ruminococcaceae bacterium OttesenSCG-928-L11]
MALLIREFQPCDKTDYIEASKQFYSLDAVLHPVPEENFASTFEECLNHNPFMKGYTFVYDDVYAGYGLVSYTWSNEVGGLVVLLEEAYILPAFQGRGIGSAYIRRVEEENSDRAKRFRLEVTRSNTAAIALYERLGYEAFDYMQMVKDL